MIFWLRVEEAKGVKFEQRQKHTSYASVSDDHLGERHVLVAQSSPVPADGNGTESSAQTSPTTTSICHVSTSESANFIQNSQCSSPNHLHQKTTVCTSIDEKIESVMTQRPKSVGKWSNYAEAHASLSSFEGIIRSLTRTKESIGRATRIAIDCAKFGVSAKVGSWCLDMWLYLLPGHTKYSHMVFKSENCFSVGSNFRNCILFFFV